MRLRFIPPLLVLAGLSGCGEELGPETIPTTEVSGIVLMSGEPLGQGWIEFQPIDGALGDIRSARIQPDGTFHADRAPIGRVAIRLINVPIEPPFAAQLFSRASPIRRTIPERPDGPIRIDAFEELLRHQGSRGRSAS